MSIEQKTAHWFDRPDAPLYPVVVSIFDRAALKGLHTSLEHFRMAQEGHRTEIPPVARARAVLAAEAGFFGAIAPEADLTNVVPLVSPGPLHAAREMVAGNAAQGDGATVRFLPIRSGST